MGLRCIPWLCATLVVVFWSRDAATASPASAAVENEDSSDIAAIGKGALIEHALIRTPRNFNNGGCRSTCPKTWTCPPLDLGPNVDTSQCGSVTCSEGRSCKCSVQCKPPNTGSSVQYECKISCVNGQWVPEWTHCTKPPTCLPPPGSTTCLSVPNLWPQCVRLGLEPVPTRPCVIGSPTTPCAAPYCCDGIANPAVSCTNVPGISQSCQAVGQVVDPNKQCNLPGQPQTACTAPFCCKPAPAPTTCASVPSLASSCAAIGQLFDPARECGNKGQPKCRIPFCCRPQGSSTCEVTPGINQACNSIGQVVDPGKACNIPGQPATQCKAPFCCKAPPRETCGNTPGLSQACTAIGQVVDTNKQCNIPGQPATACQAPFCCRAAPPRETCGNTPGLSQACTAIGQAVDTNKQCNIPGQPATACQAPFCCTTAPLSTCTNSTTLINSCRAIGQVVDVGKQCNIPGNPQSQCAAPFCCRPHKTLSCGNVLFVEAKCAAAGLSVDTTKQCIPGSSTRPCDAPFCCRGRTLCGSTPGIDTACAALNQNVNVTKECNIPGQPNTACGAPFCCVPAQPNTCASVPNLEVLCDNEISGIGDPTKPCFPGSATTPCSVPYCCKPAVQSTCREQIANLNGQCVALGFAPDPSKPCIIGSLVNGCTVPNCCQPTPLERCGSRIGLDTQCRILQQGVAAPDRYCITGSTRWPCEAPYCCKATNCTQIFTPALCGTGNLVSNTVCGNNGTVNPTPPCNGFVCCFNPVPPPPLPDKCGTHTCSKGTLADPNKDCALSGCDDLTCCQETCSLTQGQCGLFGTPSPNTKVCREAGVAASVCLDPNYCCEPRRCTDVFNSTTCLSLRPPLDIPCGPFPNGLCNSETCCPPAVTCQFYPCKQGSPAGFPDTVCRNGVCTDAQCCQFTCNDVKVDCGTSGLIAGNQVCYFPGASNVCNAANCCKPTTCGQVLTQANCTAAGLQLLSPLVACGGNTGLPRCTAQTCCIGAVPPPPVDSCDKWLQGNTCGAGTIAIANPGGTSCAAGACSAAICCRKTCETLTSQRKCQEANLIPFRNASIIPCVPTNQCSLQQCCFATCGRYVCPDDFVRKIGAFRTICPNNDCSRDLCCDATCATFPTSRCQPGYASVGNQVTCRDGGCTQAVCCAPTCATFANQCGTGNLKPNASSIFCFDRTCSATQCCDTQEINCGGPDSDGDGVNDGIPSGSCDQCPHDPSKVFPGKCGCNTPEYDPSVPDTSLCLLSSPWLAITSFPANGSTSSTNNQPYNPTHAHGCPAISGPTGNRFQDFNINQGDIDLPKFFCNGRRPYCYVLNGQQGAERVQANGFPSGQLVVTRTPNPATYPRNPGPGAILAPGTQGNWMSTSVFDFGAAWNSLSQQSDLYMAQPNTPGLVAASRPEGGKIFYYLNCPNSCPTPGKRAKCWNIWTLPDLSFFSNGDSRLDFVPGSNPNVCPTNRAFYIINVPYDPKTNGQLNIQSKGFLRNSENAGRFIIWNFDKRYTKISAGEFQGSILAVNADFSQGADLYGKLWARSHSSGGQHHPPACGGKPDCQDELVPLPPLCPPTDTCDHWLLNNGLKCPTGQFPIPNKSCVTCSIALCCSRNIACGQCGTVDGRG